MLQKVDEDMDVLSEELENIQVNHILTKMLFKEVIILNNDLVNNKICNLNISPDAVLYKTMRDKTDFTYSSNELFEIYKKQSMKKHLNRCLNCLLELRFMSI